jgi:hypothetical protein
MREDGRYFPLRSFLARSLILPQVSRILIHPLTHKAHPAVLLVPDAASLFFLLVCRAGLDGMGV